MLFGAFFSVSKRPWFLLDYGLSLHSCLWQLKEEEKGPLWCAGGLNKLYSLFTLIPSSCWRERVTKNAGKHALHGL